MAPAVDRSGVAARDCRSAAHRVHWPSCPGRGTLGGLAARGEPARGIGPAPRAPRAERFPREESTMHCHSRGFRGFDPWRRLAHELAWAGCDASSRSWAWADDEARRARRFAQRRDEDLAFGGAGLGVRRPLRFLADRLDLDDAQTQALARTLERLKLERAQAELDLRRAAAELADAFEAESFGREHADGAARLRAAAAQRVQEALARALEDLHAQLAPEQRRRLAALVRAGVIRL
jgi:hypothetical protein